MRKYLHQALLGNNEWWRYLLVTTITFAGYLFIGSIPLLLVVGRFESDGSVDQSKITEFWNTMDFTLLDIDKNSGLLLLLFSFVFGLLFLIAAYLKLHNRSYKTLITSASRLRWKRITFGFFFWMAMTVVAEYVLYKLSPEHYTYQFEIKSFIWLVILSLFVLPLQTSFEEIFFRGYMMQGLGSFMPVPVFPLIITSLAFAVVHAANPEIAEFGVGIMMAYYIGAGLLLGLVTLLDDGLELALGMHFAINFFGAVFMGYEGAVIQTDSLFKTTELNVVHMVIAFYLMAIIFLLICNRIFGWKDWGYLFSDISDQRIDIKKRKSLEDGSTIDYATLLIDNE